MNLEAAEQHGGAHQPFRRIVQRAETGGGFSVPQPHIVDAGGDGGEGGDQIIAHQIQQPDKQAGEQYVEEEETPDGAQRSIWIGALPTLMVYMALGCTSWLISSRLCLYMIRKRSALMPPQVEPTQPPKKLAASSSMMVWDGIRV